MPTPDPSPWPAGQPEPAPLDVFACPLDGATLIEASAGTGKTWAICALVLRLLLERGLELQRVLVVTFTNAATAELRERVRERLAQTLERLRGDGPATPDPFVDGLLQAMRERVGLDDATMTDRLALALQTFDEASIFTIHGFCQRALGDAPFSAGVPLRMELLPDDSEAVLQAVQDFWRQRIAGDALPPALAAQLLAGQDSPATHAALLRQVLAKPLARVAWPDDIEQPADPAAADALQQHFATARALWASERAVVLAVVDEARPRLHKTHYRAEAVAEAASGWDRWLAPADAATAGAAGANGTSGTNGANGANGTTGPSGTSNAKLALLGSAKLRAKTGQAPVPPHPFFAAAQALLDARQAVDAELERARLRLLRDLLAQAPAALQASRRARRVQTFDDLLVHLHQRLHGAGATALANALRQRFPVALIDEFQDTDPLQFAIFSRLYLPPKMPTPLSSQPPDDAAVADADAPTLFLVGDPKQAIYSFRNADLPTYLRARQRVAREATLTQNQRSVPALVDALNALFQQSPQPFLLPELVYRPVAVGSRPRAVLAEDGASAAQTAALQLWALPDGHDDGGGPVLTKSQALQRAAQACAAGIAALLARAAQGQARLGDRPLAAGDIAVLVRTHAQGARMRQALQALGVGCVELSQASVFASLDAEELERVLLAVVEPARDGAVRAALATVLLGWDAAALDALAADDTPLAAFVQRLHAWQQHWLQRGVAGMLRRLMTEQAVTARLLAQPDGERRLTNLRHLAEALHEAAAQHAAPEALLRWLQAQREEARTGPGGEAAQLRLETDRHLVQIVTIHKSKGLEYGIVFCPFLWEGTVGGSTRSGSRPEWHDAATQQTVIDLRTLDKNSAEARQIQAGRERERRAEILRLAYVALTRAVQRVVLVVGPYTSRGTENQSAASPLRQLVGDAAAWRAFAAAHAPTVSLQALPVAAGLPLSPAGTPPEAVQALPLAGPVRAAWRVGSYSSLMRGAQHDAAAPDHDARLVEAPRNGSDDNPAGLPATAVDNDDDILHFPRGAAAGECLHAVFEHLDFQAPTGWPAAVERALQQHGLAASGTLRPARAAMVQRMLRDVLHTPLPGGPRLVDVARARCVSELEFTLPVHELRAGALTAALREHGRAGPGLSFPALQGYLRGFVDLVFEHQGRFHIVDWKSNHLGTRAADYAGAALDAAMDAQGYRLQARLYGLALHRWLGRRLAGYRPAQHLGNTYYLFLRGMRPGWSDAAGAPCGVHVQPPAPALTERLSALIGAPDEALG